MKYLTILACMFAGTAVAGVTSGKLEHVDTKNKIISVDGETFHYDENTKNRTKDWRPKQGDTIVLSWFSEVDDDFQDIKYVKSFRRDQPKLAARNLPADVQVVDNDPQPVQPEPVQPEPVQPPEEPAESIEELKSWAKAEALKKKYIGERVAINVYQMRLDGSNLDKLPDQMSGDYVGVNFKTTYASEFVDVAFFPSSTTIVDAITQLISLDRQAKSLYGPETRLASRLKGTVIELNDGRIGLMIDSMKIQ